MWSSHTMGYYLAIKSNEVLIQATTWINLGSVMLSEKKARHKRKNAANSRRQKLDERSQGPDRREVKIFQSDKFEVITYFSTQYFDSK